MKTLNIQNIIVPIDFSKMSVQAIQIARQLARRFGASIHLAHVRPFTYGADFMAAAPPIVPLPFMTYEKDAEKFALKELKKVASECGVSVRYAIAFANEFGAKIILLHATYLGYIYSSEGTAIYDIPGLQKAAQKTAERKMRELVRSVKFGAVKFETAFTEGSPVIDICAFAKDHDVDLIITSTHGFTGFTHVLIGSIAEQVVRHASCSVLVVPSHPHVRAANLAKSAGAKLNRATQQWQSPNVPTRKAVTRKDRKLATHAFPERRKTNKFRESHSTP